MNPFRLPTNSQRLAVVGRTGSGKTVFSTWALSLAPFDRQPYVIVDYKRDQLIGAIDRIEEISLKEIPKKPGLYRVVPLPHEETEVNEWLWKIWERGKTGLYFDEMYNVPDPQKRSALRAVLTQGRSKRIPVIGVSQRPAWISRFLFSEADFFACFHLNTTEDVQRIGSFMPNDVGARLPPYHAHWYDVSRDTALTLSPVPSEESILQRFDERLRQRRHAY